VSRRLVRYLRFAVLGVLEHPRKSPRRRKARGPVRDWSYRAWIRSLPCAACQCSRFVEAAHVGSDGGMRQKSSDRSCVPLCAVCHRVGPRSYHVVGRTAFQEINRLDFEELVRELNAEWERRAA
jgi:hypothetical protein